METRNHDHGNRQGGKADVRGKCFAGQPTDEENQRHLRAKDGLCHYQNLDIAFGAGVVNHRTYPLVGPSPTPGRKRGQPLALVPASQHLAACGNRSEHTFVGRLCRSASYRAGGAGAQPEPARAGV